MTDIPLYFDIDTAIASERMEFRPTFNSRFDEMGIEKRNQELIKYNKYLFQLFANSGCKNKHVLSTLQSPTENAAHFVKILKSYKHATSSKVFN